MLLLNLSGFAWFKFYVANKTTVVCKVLFIISLIDQNAYLNSGDSKSGKHREKIRKGKMSFTDRIAVKK